MAALAPRGVKTGQLGLANSVLKFGAPGQTSFKQWIALEEARLERYPHLDKTFLIVSGFGVIPLPDDYNERMKAVFTTGYGMTIVAARALHTVSHPVASHIWGRTGATARVRAGAIVATSDRTPPWEAPRAAWRSRGEEI